MEKVIITGANGFIGKRLIKLLLSKNFEVWAIVRRKDYLDKYDKLHIIEANFDDYRDLDSLLDVKGFEYFYHLAWDGVDSSKFHDYDKQLKNIKATCDAFESARALKCKKFIFCGTFVEYEVRKYIEEQSTVLRISTIYGMSKLTSEMFLKTLANKYSDIELNIILPAQVYGEGDKGKTLSRVLIESINVGESPNLCTGDFLYDWIYVGDLVEAMLVIGEKGKNLKSYYAGHRKIMLFRDIVINIRNILNPNVKLKFGAYKDNALIDYSKIDLDALYNDTGFEIKSNFIDTIKNTSIWINDNK